jgi:NhaA family Na+:H+ antiporter
MSLGDPPSTRSWLGSDRPVPRLIARPLREFLDTEVAGGIVLLAAAIVALAWANSPWQESYESLWSTELTLRIGGFGLQEDLRHWVNDGLMALFFFVVGLEVKRELVEGELRNPRKAAFPSVAALGGMVAPALIYSAFNAGSAGSEGWGIPMATDIAFAVGALALFGSRCHQSLKVFLLSLAVADDVGAIVVIALFYSTGLQWGMLIAAAGLLIVMTLLRRLHVVWMPVYIVLGVAVWLTTLESGVHATIAGVVLGLLTPSRPLVVETAKAAGAELVPTEGEGFSAHWYRTRQALARERVSPLERLEHALHPWTSFVVIPIFALANAGVPLSGEDLSAAVTSRISLGVVFGLVVGKLLGILFFAWGAERLGFAEIPSGVSWSQLTGVAALGGIGFTVSLFIAELAFGGTDLLDQAKVGVLAASVVAAAMGWLLLFGLQAKPRGRGRIES